MISLKRDFILASQSPRRLALLKELGIVPAQTVGADIDETPKDKEKPLEYVRRMAESKAAAVAAQHPHTPVLAADTIVAVGHRILQKPADKGAALRQLDLLSGRRHNVYTALCMVRADGLRVVKTVKTVVIFKRFECADIAALIDSNEWQDAAGAYKIQGSAAPYVRKIIGSYTSVVGLPLYETVNLLKSNV